jgi:glycosyltransferase involved in cell wall biosynthesis
MPVAATAPQVTVLMGVFNARASLDAAIQSMLAQTYADFEFLIIDDCSTDGSAEIVEQHATLDTRIRLIRHKTNSGLGELLRRGVFEARGELVARMDADDTSLPNRLQRQVDFLRAHPEIDVVGSYALDVTKQGMRIRERRVPTTHEKIAELVWTNPFLHPTVMFRRQSILRIGSYAAIRRRQDYDLWFRCVAGGLRLANIPEPLLHYHFSEDTMKRNHIKAILDQVRIGLRGCRLVGAPAHAYLATCMPLVEAAMPNWLRLRMTALKSMVDPRRG